MRLPEENPMETDRGIQVRAADVSHDVAADVSFGGRPKTCGEARWVCVEERMLTGLVYTLLWQIED